MGFTIAIIGRPNVGKSHLFNRLIGQRLSIVEDTPGVTRDRLYATGEWLNRSFTLIDTGGIEPNTDSEILTFMRLQAEIAIDHADVVVLVCDVKSGVTANDVDVATILQKAGKPVIVAVNKMDSVGEPPADFYEFYNLGIGELYPVSALHGHGTGDLLDACFEHFTEEEESPDDDIIRVAVIGRPNVGKSSLINQLCGETRVIVSNVAGTTRDSVDTYVENEHGKFCFIDTAGIRKKIKIDSAVEKYSVLRALMAMDKAQVCVLMLDATIGVTEQDTKIAGFAHEKGKAVIVCMNKWDLVEKETNTMEHMKRELDNDLAYMTYAPKLFFSALTGQRTEKLYEQILYTNQQNCMRISTGQLNDILAEAVARVQPPSDKGRRLKIYYMTQVSTRPPTFVCFCNKSELFHFSYRRYLENQIRAVFGLQGTTIHMIIRQKGDEQQP